MVLSTTAKHFLLTEAFFMYSDIVRKEYGDAAASEFFEMTFSYFRKS